MTAIVVLAMIILGGLAVAQSFIIYALLNRLLAQAKIQPLMPAPPKREEPVETPRPRPVFTVPIVD